MADVEENMEEVAVEQEDQAKAEDTPVADDKVSFLQKMDAVSFKS